jgi:hypothetical protein
MADEIVHCGTVWQVLEVPELVFTEIGKEKNTHGTLYLLNDRLKSVGFVCQSLPPATAAINQKLRLHLHSSSFYRILRKESKKSHMHKNWTVREYNRDSLEKFNEAIGGIYLLYFVTKNPDIYAFINPEASGEYQNSGRTYPEDRGPEGLCRESQTVSS